MTDDLISDLDVVLHNDPALDLSRMDWRRYLKTRDPQLIVDRPGLRARRFRLRALDVVEYATVAQQTGDYLKAVMTVRHALVSVTPGLDGVTTWHPSKEEPDSFGRLKRIMSLAEVDEMFARGRVRFGALVMGELAAVALERAESGNVDGGGEHYSPPRAWEQELERRARLLAEQTRETSTTQTTAPSSSG